MDASQEDSAPAGWRRVFQIRHKSRHDEATDDHDRTASGRHPPPPKWSMGMRNDPDTVEVPGSVLLLAAHRNQPLGLRNVRARTSHSSIPVEPSFSPGGTSIPSAANAPGHLSPTSASNIPAPEHEKKTTSDGTIILEPQPDESANDPLNWPAWRRDSALLSLGLYCMIGGGMTPLIAAGFHIISVEYNVSEESMALTTGLYMMGLGVGSVLFSPTAILWGKRPVYLFSVLIFIGSSIWAGYSPSFNSLLGARVLQGIAVSPVECLPSATIAEIFFLHERAYRIGIYTLLLLGGKNLVPLVSAVIINGLGWRWVFYITAIIAGAGGLFLFLFVPETFWDRTPHRKQHKRPNFFRRISSRHGSHTPRPVPHPSGLESPRTPVTKGVAKRSDALHVGFAGTSDPEKNSISNSEQVVAEQGPKEVPKLTISTNNDVGSQEEISRGNFSPLRAGPVAHGGTHQNDGQSPITRPNSAAGPPATDRAHNPDTPTTMNSYQVGTIADEKALASKLRDPPKIHAYTHNLRQQPAQSFIQRLKPYHGRLNNDNWFKAMVRPFILFSYPAVLWSAIVYACSIGWLIVISESLTLIYGNKEYYGFTSLQSGLVYLSPFVGGILGTGVAGKVSDFIVKNMARRNGGLYEPEFRLVMAIPITISTCIGLMGFGWSAEERDHWIVPTLFFGIISFGCSLGSTTSITFCVDSYRQYAGEALVTLNFSKNIFHGLIFSLFFTHWLVADGFKTVFIWIGVIQLILMVLTIPMYIFGKRARMWTVKKNMMEKF